MYKHFIVIVPINVSLFRINIKCFIIWAFFSLCYQVNGQSGQVLLGKVIDKSSGEVIPFSHITFAESVIGTSTNLDGHFELRLPPGTGNHFDIKISCIGYAPVVLQIENVSDERITFVLSPVTTSLDGVVVTANKSKRKKKDMAAQLMRKAIRRIPKNYSNEPTIFPSFYRHYCAENGNYVRLIEAALELRRSGKDPYEVLVPQDNLGFGINQLRRSFDFTKNSHLSHPPISLNYLLIGDLTAYDYSNPLKGQPTKYSLSDTTSFDGNDVFIIQFQTAPEGVMQKRYHGKVFLQSTDLAFLRFEINEESGWKSASDSTDILTKRVFLYKKHAGQYFVDRTSLDLWALHFSYDELGEVMDSVVHTSHIELITNNILPNREKLKGDGEPTSKDLVNVEYDSTFWDHYNILEATEVEAKIIADLSKKIDLRKQFELFNTIEEGGKSIVESEPFKKLLSKYDDTPTYVVVWSEATPANYFDIRPHQWLLKKLKKEKVDLVMVSLDTDDAQWKTARELYQLNQPGVIHDRIDFEFDSDLIKELFKDVLPFYCFFDEKGTLISSDPPLPSHQDVQFLIRPQGLN